MSDALLSAKLQLALKWHPDKNQENPLAEEIVCYTISRKGRVELL